MDERETGKILEIVKRTDANVTKIFDTINDHETRIAVIETTRPSLIKIVSGVSVSIGIILAIYTVVM
ncbi:hypothetical protein LCGC14_0692840 [marine sediment metagenome]|uniref:Uncharacterized protein n=1 Tax=marine sediment metagenome TaxID=412755 RepID=A0A0F9R5B1_9ZZZZ